MTLTKILTVLCVITGIYAIIDLYRLQKRLEDSVDLLDTRAATLRAPVQSEQNGEYCTGHAAPVVNGYCFECGFPRLPRSTRSDGG